MSLNELTVGDKALIEKIECDKNLRNRFYSFGIVKGANLSVEAITLAKSTMEICVNKTKIALRMSEAERIGVSRV